ncbi:transport permease protein [Microtetraspora sp. NBRC 13810]|uniref:ABC transporter permease n=1 Tax=Microtetraspora sp. NBRC 13810 TaxID=3030990 RepID=UPI0024A51EDF|nr:ABC transporter permease [Microtetraspora sp. NBRC 13810]GLW05100.1 transport permease protein [Microtetraspora sp. NBRC 13810]
MTADLRHAVRLAGMDLRLLGRNQTALVTVLLLPLLMSWLFSWTGGDTATVAGVPGALFMLTGMPGLMLCFAVFINLVNVYTARREELVLKRLRTGQASPAGILGGTALGGLVLYMAQIALLVAWIMRAEDGPAPANVPLLLLAAVLGTAVFALLAMAFSGITASAELAQVTVLPVLLVTMVAGPYFAPLSAMPEPLRQIAQAVPATPVVEIFRTAYLGADFVGDAGGPLSTGEQWLAALPSLGILLAWTVLAGLAARWLFRWDPRRG